MESNSVIRFLRPDLYLTVLDADNEDFKDSAREFLNRADAVVLHQSNGRAKWKTVSINALAGKPIFKIQPPPYVTDEVVAFVREKLSARGMAVSLSNESEQNSRTV
jgi:UDP-N-acetylmuramate-alanine ligase